MRRGQRATLGYEIDGVVLKVDSMPRSSAWLHRARAALAIAYKFTAKSGVTQMVDIMITVGRTGKLTRQRC